jgi:putative drug exporter of the RND superfamily
MLPREVAMLHRIGSAVIGRARIVALVALVIALGTGALGADVASRLSLGGFTDPGSPSAQAQRLLSEQLHRPTPNLMLVVSTPEPVASPAAAAEGLALTDRLSREPGVSQVASFWSLGSPPELAGRDGRTALVVASAVGDEHAVRATLARVVPAYTRADGPIRVRVGGSAEVSRAIDEAAEADLHRAEAVVLPVTLVLLICVFGGLVAALLPLAVAVVATLVTMAVLRALTGLTPVSLFALNLTTGLGLGLAIDYSLFLISRYREELRKGFPVEAAIVRALGTAGRTVLFSAGTVAACLAALLVFPLGFLRSTAYAGIVVVSCSAGSALVLLPALLVLVGGRIDALDPFRSMRRHPARHRRGRGPWYALAERVLRRPALPAVGVTVVLLVLATPFLHVRFANADDRTLPPTSVARQTQEALRADFPFPIAGQATVVMPAIDPASAGGRIAAAMYAGAFSVLPGVGQATGPTGRYRNGTLVAGAPTPASPGPAVFTVLPTVDPGSAAAERLVRVIRSDTPDGTLVAGATAEQLDARAALDARTPLALLLVAAVTAALVLLFTGGVLLAAKAIVVNLLSLSASFGAMVWVFQDGHLRDLLGGFAVTGAIDATTPILMFCVAFGLSMDYEILLLGRIKEAHDRGVSTNEAVKVGLQASAGLMTAAAAIVAVVFLALTGSQVAFLKLLGLGLATAVVLDATLVRGVLVPACVGLAGDANWWAPAPLRRLARRVGDARPGPERVPWAEPESELWAEPEPDPRYQPSRPAPRPGTAVARVGERMPLVDPLARSAR